MKSRSIPPILLSYGIALLLLLAGAAVCTRERQRVDRLQARVMELESQRQGPTSGSERTRPDRQGPEERLAAARHLAARMLDISIRMSEEPESDEWRGKWLQAQRELLGFDAAQTEELLVFLIDATEPGVRHATRVAEQALRFLADLDPVAALRFLDTIQDAESIFDVPGYARVGVLQRWAVRDPHAAAEAWWARRDSEPQTSWSSAWNQLLREVAATDPRLAIELMESRGEGDFASAPSRLLAAAGTPEAQAAAIAKMREWNDPDLASAEDRSAAWAAFWNEKFIRRGIAPRFDQAIAFLEGHELTPEEVSPLIGQLSYHRTTDDYGRWMTWFASLPAEGPMTELEDHFEAWAVAEPAAATRWLEQAPAGGLRDELTANYVEQALRASRPELALPQLPSLPQGERRDMLLREMYGIYLRSDPARAAAFAREHGLGD